MKTTYDGENFKEELMFTGIDIVSFIKEILDSNKELITSAMSKENLEGYEFGINTVFDQINQFIEAMEEDDDFIVLTKDKNPVEYDIKELEELSRSKEK